MTSIFAEGERFLRLEQLTRIQAGWYETEDQEFSISRDGGSWMLMSGKETIATRDTKISCECDLARIRS